MKQYVSQYMRLGLTLGVSSVVSVGFFIVGMFLNRSGELWYLNWNLVLAWVPLGLIVLLSYDLRRERWSSWRALTLTMAFVAFLPNTFYLMTDVIHLQEAPRVDLMFDVAMFMSFVLNGCALGFISVYLLHQELATRLRRTYTWLVVAGILLVTSFAIYIGRELRWNTWDILVNPASILFQISESLLHPTDHPEVFSITFSFFVLISSLYAVVWSAARALQQQKTL